MTQLELEDDAAYVNLGGNWRMPTHAEELELSNNCSSESCTINGIKGYRFVAVNGNEIFFPFGGLVDGTDYACNDTDVVRIGEGGWYWSSTLNSLGSGYAQGLCFWPSLIYYVDHERCDGHMIRPVYDDRIHPESVSLNKSTLSLSVGVSEQLIASVLPDNATDKSLTWSSDNTNVAAVDSAGNVTAIAAGSATITVTTTDGAKTATCVVTVVDAQEPEAIDLGLPSGLKWATFNVGATKPEEYGNYFAWGETEPKTDYGWSTYYYELGTDFHGPFSKYVTNSSYGTVDNNTVLNPEEDAATVNWGGNWRMPTYDDWYELMNNCSCIWTGNYNGTGVTGRIVTSNVYGYTDKSIFLPSAGSRHDTDLGGAGSGGAYWSSSLYTDGPYRALFVVFRSNFVQRSSNYRCYGQSIRPVFDNRIHPTSVSLIKTTLSLYIGKSEQLMAIISPDDATDKSVTWSSDKTDVATVDENGKVTAVSAGTAIITVTTNDGNMTATCGVSVEPLPEPEAVDMECRCICSRRIWRLLRLG